MATKAFQSTVLKQGDSVIPGVNVYTWPSLAQGDDGAPLMLPHFADRSVQFVGATFGGAQVVLEGSNDGTNYETLTDPQGNDIQKSGADLEAVTEVTAYVRPRVIGGDVNTNITAVLLIRAAQ